ncbi:hypothetical protein [Agrobacterium tumefaciens]|jgi:hypothetical protein|uniref:hypothetical protein n=1 Tax=Agrobacterium tumefaciens TaxID=358 RepID=UPI0016597D81|nr:hypothetical protein [Agrobacterium tumefaciens]QNP78603.1 hypothetical protein IAI05_08570 [Agrobacterium tumefaciens]
MHLIDFIGVVVVFSAIGAFIDFWIGKKGQSLVRARLEDRWLRFSDLLFENFGRAEAHFSLNCIDRLFGFFFSKRRALIILFATVVGFATVEIGALFHGVNIDRFFILFYIALCLVIISLSISIFQLIARSFTNHWPTGWAWSLTYISLAVTIQIFALIFASMVTPMILSMFVVLAWNCLAGRCLLVGQILDSIFTGIYDDLWILVSPSKGNLSSLISQDYGKYSNEYFSIIYLSIILHVLALARIFLLLIFIFSFLFSPAHKFISTLWLRTLETEKPIFTVVFGAIGAMCKAVIDISKIFT